jgi:hypothetical protein
MHLIFKKNLEEQSKEKEKKIKYRYYSGEENIISLLPFFFLKFNKRQV